MTEVEARERQKDEYEHRYRAELVSCPLGIARSRALKVAGNRAIPMAYSETTLQHRDIQVQSVTADHCCQSDFRFIDHVSNAVKSRSYILDIMTIRRAVSVKY